MSRTLVAMQPYFFPYGGYFSLMNAASVFIFLDTDQFVPRRWMNRSLFLRGATETWVTLPVDTRSGSRKPLNQTYGAIQSPDYLKFIRIFQELTGTEAVRRYPHLELASSQNLPLSELNILSLIELATELEVELPEFHRFSQLAAPKKTDGDFQARAARLSLEFGCDVYLNPSGGRSLYSPDIFEKAGIELNFMENYVKEEKDRYSVLSTTQDKGDIRMRIQGRSKYSR